MDDPTERWRPVPGWENLYEVSDLGRVRSLDRMTRRGIRPGRVLKPFLSDQGYQMVDLSLNEVKTRWLVHRLVAAAFMGPCPPGQEVRHGPNGKLDNRASQLCYGTRSENRLDMIRDGTMRLGEANNKARLTAAIVVEIRRRYAAGGCSTYSLAREFGVGRSAVSNAVSGRTWAHIGYML